MKLLAETTPAWFVAFDLLALDDTDYTGQPFAQRRAPRWPRPWYRRRHRCA